MASVSQKANGRVNQVGDEDDLRLKVTQSAVDTDPDNPGIRPIGDGTVPAMSARLTPLAPERRFRIQGAEHAGCFGSQPFMDQVLECRHRLLA